MNRMILKKLIVSGVGKKDAILEFREGLNVITGDSDTGKTYAFQCLNYILGGEKEPKAIPEAKDYEKISLGFKNLNDIHVASLSKTNSELISYILNEKRLKYYILQKNYTISN